MDKKLPSISKFSDDKEFLNNKQTYYSFVEKSEEDRNSRNGGNDEIIDDEKMNTLDDLFNNGQFIFNIPVNIKTSTNSILTMIVGKVNDHIITSDNQIIKIEDIISIKVN